MRRLSIGRRLAALVVLPALCVAVLAVPLTADRLQLARAGAEVETTAAYLARLVALRSGVHAERVAVEAALQGGALGMPTEQVSNMLGFDIVRAREEADRQTDTAAAALGGAANPIDLDALHALRQRVDGAPPDDIDDIVQAYVAVDGQLRRAMVTTFDQLEINIAGVATSPLLRDAIQAVRAGTDELDAVNDQMRALELMLFNAGDTRSLVALANGRARAATAEESLDNLRAPALAQGWEQIRDGAQVTHVRGAVDSALHGTTPDPELGALPRLAAISRDGLDGERQLYRFINAAGVTISQEAATLAHAATRDLVTSFSLTAAMLLVLVWASIRLLHSVRSPLRRLTAYADAVSHGRLDIEPLGDDGPEDVVTLMTAFDELVANLRLLEAKAHALAACAFDAPVLDESVPGALGESLQRSVQVLSGSIVERDELQRHLAHQATHDALTGLPNRAAATATLEHALRRVRRLGNPLAVLFIDLDEFKPINDVHGHPVGDEVLRTVAARMTELVRGTDFLARLGGDEFVLVTENAEDASGVAALATRLIAVASEPVTVGHLSVQVGASVGIAFAVDGNDDADQLLTCADLAVYRAKQHGRGRAEIYDRRMQEELVARAEVREALADAIRNDELFLEYQPVFTAGESRLSGVEALVRWNRPGRGVQPPDNFIPAAEESPRLIIELDCWVLNRAAEQIKAWETDPVCADLDVAVNISGQHLVNRDLVDHVAAVLDRTGIDPHRLVLEITETVLLNDLDVAAEQLIQLRAMGIRIAIDDFGTGYTSVTHLARLPVDVLKIDRSFLDNQLDHRARTLLAMMIDLGHHLGLMITAEGVETDEQLELLRTLSCDHTQGFLFSRPVDPHQIAPAPVPVSASEHPRPVA
jgi:diguanylate cyclase (GGDEF)-like protein